MLSVFVVLGRANADGQLDADGVRRIEHLEKIKDKHPHVQTVILSGGSKSIHPISEAAQMEALLSSEWEKIIHEDWSHTTIENAMGLAQLLQKIPVKEIYLITSREHALRAYLCVRYFLRQHKIKVHLRPSKGIGIRGWLYELRCIPHIYSDLVRARKREKA